MGKVEMRRVDSLPTNETAGGVRVTLITADGNEIQEYLGQPTGMPGNPLTDQRLHEKFLRCAEAGAIDGTEARGLLEHLDALERVPLAFAPFWKPRS